MNLIIKINLDNDAFQDNDGYYEVGRMLKQLAIDILKDGELTSRYLFDINGNNVGTLKLEE